MEIVGQGNKNPQKAGQPQQQVQLDLMAQPDLDCGACGSKFFEQAYMFKTVSKLLTGAPEDQIAPVQVFRCMDCGTPLEQLMPKTQE